MLKVNENEFVSDFDIYVDVDRGPVSMGPRCF